MGTRFWDPTMKKNRFLAFLGPVPCLENDGNNNGQATHGTRKHAWRTQAAWAN